MTGVASIRPFADADEDAVVALWQAVGLTRPWNDPHRDITRKKQVQRELFLVAAEGADIVGTAMAGYDGHRGWVWAHGAGSGATRQRRDGRATGITWRWTSPIRARGWAGCS